ncbi:DUF6876 family protein [Rhodopseudomonas sp.]|uniref:DUF6876 family protein n=1 Tax=Rhodopseudomonas sp. TaxID=1078 RepID=UPI003B3B242B
MNDTKLTDLHQFTGTTQWYRHPLNRNVLFTDGAKYVADHAGAYWLLDEIALAQISHLPVRAEAFQVWKLDVQDGSGTLTCTDGNDGLVYTKDIPFTDFPACGVALWFTDGVILLPTEY